MRKGWLLMLVAGMLLVSACGAGNTNGSPGKPGDGNQAGGGTLEKARSQGYITVGFANENPYAYKEADGTLTGEAVEIARAILERLGISEMRGELTEFGGLIGGLQAGRFDMITAGMFINENRCKQVAFANPEYSIGEAIAVKQGNPLNLKSYEDIASSGAKVAVMTGAVEIEYLEKSGVKDSQMVITPDQDAAVNALQSGRADVMTMTDPALRSRLASAQDDKIERVEDFKQPVVDGNSVRGYGASAFRPADTQFVEAFNAELEKLKESGELLAILEKFGFTDAELPGDMTAAELCG
ncbi:ectoine/hydroxyectoine ABC transporter substrate-binding protein EhuB [Paenibacillus sp. GCM10012307]|uniref:Ectoine/hydroxyectoine ABC transporter substrate-binding protein EhuB n=1 Tax=Paenibacillus roseus TaxID=2798579 RepID=A0A934J669_9BACL|nr:ectoine/hydroxyectoine ABC transporter substrate-binding protein EhuB [Paenibacillus roseus]MBJ6362328.1 ectoine/hydroxyectoine ABC transporter substrate-binding protein EhuB [Paenibacillus roseus]